MTRNYEGSQKTGRCWHGQDEIDCEPDEMYIERCDERDERQLFDFVPVSVDEVLIKVHGQDRCFERDDRLVKLKGCNQHVHTQRFFAVRGGFNQPRFEIGQKTMMGYCLQNDHHPKAGEGIRVKDCETGRKRTYNTTWYEVYW
jgi:hypothetical protein